VVAQRLLDHRLAADLPCHERLGRLARTKPGHADTAGEVVQGVIEGVVALDFGHAIAEGTPAEMQRHPEVVRAFVKAVREASRC